MLTDPKNYARHQHVPEQEVTTYLPVGHEDRREKTPNIKKHTDPRTDDTHPHRRFGAPDVDVVTVGRRRRRARTNKVPEYGVEIVSATTGNAKDILIPVGEQHRHVHSAKYKDDVEPRILKGCQMSQISVQADEHYNGCQNARHPAIHHSRHRPLHRPPH